MITARRYPLSSANGNAIPLEVIQPLGVIPIAFTATAFKSFALDPTLDGKVFIASTDEACYLTLDVPPVGTPEVPYQAPVNIPGRDTPAGESWLGYDWLGGRGFIAVLTPDTVIPEVPYQPAVPGVPPDVVADTYRTDTLYIPAYSAAIFVTGGSRNINVKGMTKTGTCVLQVVEAWAGLAIENQLHRI